MCPHRHRACPRLRTSRRGGFPKTSCELDATSNFTTCCSEACEGPRRNRGWKAAARHHTVRKSHEQELERHSERTSVGATATTTADTSSMRRSTDHVSCQPWNTRVSADGEVVGYQGAQATHIFHHAMNPSNRSSVDPGRRGWWAWRTSVSLFAASRALHVDTGRLAFHAVPPPVSGWCCRHHLINMSSRS